MLHTEELDSLDKKIFHMGGLAEHNLGQAFDALINRNPHLAYSVISADADIDQLQIDIEKHIVTMMAQNNTTDSDIRNIMACLKIAGDLERIGDLAKNIAKRVVAIVGQAYPRPLIVGIQNMLERALSQLKDVLDAYTCLLYTSPSPRDA